ncbi:MAG: DUF1150 domain-containing protein [Pseudomonadota bacterium]|nr:DUF1150 domain-containing protein [Pseudomonadota bacterium]
MKQETRTRTYAYADLPMPSGEFAALGVNSLAYIRPVVVSGEKAFSVHAADGTALTVLTGTRDEAFATIRDNQMEPLSVH